MALYALQEKGILKHVVSQNTDGLHLKSGIKFQNLTELHGNTNLEHCMSCCKNYLRDYRARTAEIPTEHKTGRHCDDPDCNGELVDQIINFGEKIP
jgi:NAD-dependent SIR2 family protein deacetylase